MKDINSANQKLDRGCQLLAQAGDDSIYLATALRTIHGALEDACRVWLSQPKIATQHRKEIQNPTQTSWQDILELMEKHYNWKQTDLKYVQRINKLRNTDAHGDEFYGRRKDVEEYADFVKEIFNQQGASNVSNHIDQNYSQEQAVRNFQAINPNKINCPNCNSYKYKRIGIWAMILTISLIAARLIAGILFFTAGTLLLSQGVKVLFSFLFGSVLLGAIALSPYFLARVFNPRTSYECLRCSYRWQECSYPILSETLKLIIIPSLYLFSVGYFISLLFTGHFFQGFSIILIASFILKLISETI
jgi:hypothetical protein